MTTIWRSLDEEGVAHDAAEDLIKFYAKPHFEQLDPAMLRNSWARPMKPAGGFWRRQALGSAGRRTYAATTTCLGFGRQGRGGCIANGMTIKSA